MPKKLRDEWDWWTRMLSPDWEQILIDAKHAIDSIWTMAAYGLILMIAVVFATILAFFPIVAAFLVLKLIGVI